MASKLRSLYDKLYVGVEAWLLARESRQDAKKYARLMGPNPRVDAEYDTTIRDYWKQFRVRMPKKFWFTLFANPNREFSPKYIPDDLWFFRILPHFNNLIFAKALQDKCLYSVLFPDVRQPVTVVKCVAGVFYGPDMDLLTEEQAAARCHGHGRIIVKPSVCSGQGHNIRFFDSDGLTVPQAKDIFRMYGKNFIVQEKMAQHPDLARVNPSSLNTVRVITFLHGGQVHVLTAILRAGGSKSEVDNTSQGGYKSTVLPDGHLAPEGMNTHFQYCSHYENGIAFADVTVPSYDRVLDTARRLAARMGHFKIIGWDIAVAPDGEPVLVEFNVIPAAAHATNGPLFGPLTDEVLTEVFGRRDSHA